MLRIEKNDDDYILTQIWIDIAAQLVVSQPSNKKGKITRNGTRGYLIDSFHLNILISSYHKHLNEYCKKNSYRSNCSFHGFEEYIYKLYKKIF
jgi:hypothetical protein